MQRTKRDNRVVSINGTSTNVYRDNSKPNANKRGGGRGKTTLNPKDKVVIRQMIESKINYKSEKKFVGTESNYDVSYNGTLIKLTPIIQGLHDSERVGDQVTLDRMRVSYSVNVGDTVNVFRLFIFRWKILSTPIINTLFIGSSQGWYPYADYNVDLLPDFDVLYDKNHYLSTSDANQGDVLEIDLSGKIQFTAGTGDGIGHIYALVISDSAATPSPYFNMAARVYYYDD